MARTEFSGCLSCVVVVALLSTRFVRSSNVVPATRCIGCYEVCFSYVVGCFQRGCVVAQSGTGFLCLHSAPGVFACYEAFPMLRAALHEADSWTSRGLVALSTRGVCLLRAFHTLRAAFHEAVSWPSRGLVAFSTRGAVPRCS